MSIPLPDNKFCENLNKKLYKFIWDDKPEKILNAILSQNKMNWGLKMPNIDNFINSLKCTWIRRLLVSSARLWVKLFEFSYCSLKDLIENGPYFGIKVSDNVPNDFMTLSPPTSEAGVWFTARPQVGKLVVACHWLAVCSTES